MLQATLTILGQALYDTSMMVASLLPSVILAIVLFVIGWALGALLQSCISSF